LGVTDEGVARLRLVGSCDGCPSSAVTLELAVRTPSRRPLRRSRAIELSAETPAPAAAA
jgi:Fe-S cluster biogenesis protein NfuA